MVTKQDSSIMEKDSYYVLRHKPTGLYVNQHDMYWGDYDLEQTSLVDNPEYRGGYAPFRLCPIVGDSAVSALDLAHGNDCDVVTLQANQEARKVIDWLKQNDHYNSGADSKCDYEYSDFELMLVEVEYSVKSAQPVAASA
jgi:hypothetical protein